MKTLRILFETQKVDCWSKGKSLLHLRKDISNYLQPLVRVKDIIWWWRVQKLLQAVLRAPQNTFSQMLIAWSHIPFGGGLSLWTPVFPIPVWFPGLPYPPASLARLCNKHLRSLASTCAGGCLRHPVGTYGSSFGWRKADSSPESHCLISHIWICRFNSWLSERPVSSQNPSFSWVGCHRWAREAQFCFSCRERLTRGVWNRGDRQLSSGWPFPTLWSTAQSKDQGTWGILIS